LKTPVSIAPDALDFRRLIGRGETVGWAEATAEPLSSRGCWMLRRNVAHRSACSFR
jgi:hypothetical protein